MALEELVLVRPRQFPHAEASARASGADDRAGRARGSRPIWPARCTAAVWCWQPPAASAISTFRVLDVRAAARRAVEEAARAPVAVMFGSERTGLTNEELRYAHALLRIPTNPDYASLNIAMAVQIVGYEILRARLEAHDGLAGPPAGRARLPLASPEEMDRMYAHLAVVLEEIDFRDRTQSGRHLMKRHPPAVAARRAG